MSIQGSRRPQDRGVTPNLIVRGVMRRLSSISKHWFRTGISRHDAQWIDATCAASRWGLVHFAFGRDDVARGNSDGIPAETRRHLGDFGDLRRRRELGFSTEPSAPAARRLAR